MQSSEELERHRAMDASAILLKEYLAKRVTANAANPFPLLGQVLGRMIPRCSDPSIAIRQTAIDCIQITLRIAICMPGEYEEISQVRDQSS